MRFFVEIHGITTSALLAGPCMLVSGGELGRRRPAAEMFNEMCKESRASVTHLRLLVVTL